MKISEQVLRLLRDRKALDSGKELKVTEDDILWFQRTLGVRPTDLSFIYFYTNVTIPPIGNGDELHTLESIIEEKEEEYHEEECPGLYERFLQLSSIEGEGSYFFEIETGKVYDANWGEEHIMMEGTLSKCWKCFAAFLDWYYINRDGAV